jgi:hypothetical protein
MRFFNVQNCTIHSKQVQNPSLFHNFPMFSSFFVLFFEHFLNVLKVLTLTTCFKLGIIPSEKGSTISDMANFQPFEVLC